MEPLGVQLRRQRHQLGLTLDELASRTGISKPYLSLIETGRVPNPPSDEKLRRLETTLAFKPGELVSQAHLQRTPQDVRLMLSKLIRENDPPTAEPNGKPAPQKSTALPAAAIADLAATTHPIAVINTPSSGYPTAFVNLADAQHLAVEYVGCPDVHDRHAFAIRVVGDQMTPKYSSGDIVILSPAESARHGDDCFIRFANGMTSFARVFFESDDAGEAVLRLQPRNERYRPQIVPANRIAGLDRAIYRYHQIDAG